MPRLRATNNMGNQGRERDTVPRKLLERGFGANLWLLTQGVER
jgi:hypothetical protein